MDFELTIVSEVAVASGHTAKGRFTDSDSLRRERQCDARRIPTLVGHQVSCTELVKSLCRVGASTGTSHVSYCRNGLISRSLRTRSIAGDVPVPLRAAAGNKVVGDLGVADPNLNAALRADVIGAPRLVALALTANPAAHQVAIVEIQIVVDHFPVDEVSADTGGGGRIGVNRLGAEVELGEPGNVGQIDSRDSPPTARSADRRYVVVHQRIAVQRQPAPQVRHAATKSRSWRGGRRDRCAKTSPRAARR